MKGLGVTYLAHDHEKGFKCMVLICRSASFMRLKRRPQNAQMCGFLASWALLTSEYSISCILHFGRARDLLECFGCLKRLRLLGTAAAYKSGRSRAGNGLGFPMRWRQ